MADEPKHDGREEADVEEIMEEAELSEDEAAAGERQDVSDDTGGDPEDDTGDADSDHMPSLGEFDDLFGDAGLPASPNSRVFGTVTLHYPERDVRVVLDGATALRLLSMFARRRTGPSDPLDPDSSTALAGWLVLDLNELLAVSWWPSLSELPDRTVLDPPMPTAA